MQIGKGLMYYHIVVAIGVMCLPRIGSAMFDWPSRVPNGSVFSCNTCHTSNIPERNAFGADFKTRGKVWSATLAGLDSDGDGRTNGVELLDLNGTWTQGQANPGNNADVTNPGVANPTPVPTNTTQPVASPTPTATNTAQAVASPTATATNTAPAGASPTPVATSTLPGNQAPTATSTPVPATPTPMPSATETATDLPGGEPSTESSLCGVHTVFLHVETGGNAVYTDPDLVGNLFAIPIVWKRASGSPYWKIVDKDIRIDNESGTIFLDWDDSKDASETTVLSPDRVAKSLKGDGEPEEEDGSEEGPTDYRLTLFSFGCPPGDVDGSGGINAKDLLMLQHFWRAAGE